MVSEPPRLSTSVLIECHRTWICAGLISSTNGSLVELGWFAASVEHTPGMNDVARVWCCFQCILPSKLIATCVETFGKAPFVPT